MSYLDDFVHVAQWNLPVFGGLVLSIGISASQSGEVFIFLELGVFDYGGHDSALHRGSDPKR